MNKTITDKNIVDQRAQFNHMLHFTLTPRQKEMVRQLILESKKEIDEKSGGKTLSTLSLVVFNGDEKLGRTAIDEYLQSDTPMSDDLFAPVIDYSMGLAGRLIKKAKSMRLNKEQLSVLRQTEELIAGMWTHYERDLKSVVRSIKDVEITDLYINFVQSMDTFDVSRGNTFRTHAIKSAKGAAKSIGNKAEGVISLNTAAYKTYLKVFNILEELEVSHNNRFSFESVCQAIKSTGISDKKALELAEAWFCSQQIYSQASIDAEIEEGFTIGDSVAAEGCLEDEVINSIDTERALASHLTAIHEKMNAVESEGGMLELLTGKVKTPEFAKNKGVSQQRAAQMKMMAIRNFVS